MKIYEEVLSEELLNVCKEDLIKKQNKPIWSSSSLTWEHNVLQNIDGVCLSTPIGDDKICYSLSEELYPAIKDFKCDVISYNYNIWDSYSGLSIHNDDAYKFAATLYLNTNFVYDGGLFVWQDDECPDNFYRCICPQENMMVVNDSKQDHFVTPISPHSRQYRYTIQIWGK